MMRGELVGDPELVRYLLRGLERAWGHPSPEAPAPQGGKRTAAKLPPMCACGLRPTRQPLPFTKERQNCAECSVTAREKVRTDKLRRGLLAPKNKKSRAFVGSF